MIDIRKSLATKLSLTVLLLAAPIFIISLGLLFMKSRQMIREEAVGRANSVMNTTMQRMLRYISAVKTATEANSVFITENTPPDSVLALTRFIVSHNPSIDGCSISMEPNVFPEYGRYFSAYTIREEEEIISVIEQPYEYFGKIWYKTPHDMNSTCWVDYFDEVDSLEVVLNGMLASYCMPIHRADGRILAIVSTDISLKRLSKNISEEKPYPNAYFMMIDSEGHYVVHPDSTRLFTQSIFDGADPGHDADIIALGHQMTNRNEGTTFLEIDGVRCLVSYQPVPGIAWSLALVCPDSDILKGYHKQTYILLPLLLFGLIIILFICYHAVNHSIRPINELLAKTHSIASGNMEIHIPRSQRTDDIGTLQNSFASMLQRLNFHMGSVRYMTEQAQQRYEELAKATRLAEEADRQKTAFIQNVTHQIRTPLNIIMGFSQILNDPTLPPLSEEEMKGITGTMNHNSKLLSRMIAMLFDSSDTGFVEELNSKRQDTVACNKLVRETISYINLHYPDINIDFQTEVDDDFCLQTNYLYLMRSLRELLYNSAKYSDGKHVSISISVDEKHVWFTVEDTGNGITEADLDRMFTFFTKMDDLSEGLGLGLPLAKRHILNLGGDLIIDTNYHEGCRFIVKIPR